MKTMRLRYSLRKLARMLIILLILSMSLSACGNMSDSTAISFEGAESAFLLTPVEKTTGEPYRLAILDSEPGESSSQLLYGFLEELRTEGWLAYEDLPFSERDTAIGQMVNMLSQMELGKYISFETENYFEMTGDNLDLLKEALREKTEEGKIDIILAMGTAPGLFLKELKLDLPILVTMATDPIASGIIQSTEDSGDPNLWALVEPNPMGRQLNYYIDMFKIATLGMITVKEYEEVAAVPAYELAAKQQNVAINKVALTYDSGDEIFDERLGGAIEEMAERDVDAFLLTYGLIEDAKKCGNLIQPFLDRKIPVLVSDGEALVEEGGLLCVSSYDYVGYGGFCARVAASIFNGKSAGSLPCEYVSAPNIVLNMETAKKIGFETEFQFLLSCDKIFAGGGEVDE